MGIRDSVFEILSELCGIESIMDGDKLREDLGFDSLAMVTLLINIEDRFEIELDESDMNPFDLTKASDVINLVFKYCYKESKLKEASHE